MNLKRLFLLTVVALAVVASAAVPASADILSPGAFGSVYSDCDPGGDPQDCPVKGVRSGAAPTFTRGSMVVTCRTANIDGFVDGDATTSGPANGVLNFSWESCTTSSGTEGCSVDDITGVDVDITEANAPSATIINTVTAATTITCASVFSSCNWSWNPSTTPVTAELDQDSQVATINDVGDVAVSFGCPDEGPGMWSGQYLITDDQDQDLDLWATGTL